MRRTGPGHHPRAVARPETELAAVTAELSALDRPAIAFVATGERMIELVKRIGIVYKIQDPGEQRRHVRSLKALSYLQEATRSVQPRQRNWRLAGPGGRDTYGTAPRHRTNRSMNEPARCTACPPAIPGCSARQCR
jgi:hypothetical protein